MYSFLPPGRIALSTIPTIDATASPERAMFILPILKEIAPDTAFHKTIPHTNRIDPITGEYINPI